MAAQHPSASRVGSTRAHPRIDAMDVTLVVLMLLGCLVFVEPAPFDLLIILVAPIALVMRRLAIPRVSAFALVCVAVSLLTNVVSLHAVFDVGAGLRYFAITLYLLLAWMFVLGVVGRDGERAIRLMMLGWTIGAALTTAISIGAYFNVVPFKEVMVPDGRMQGLFKDANVFSAYLVAPAVWSASRVVALERTRRGPWAAALVICSVGVLLSYSRGAWISLAIALASFFGLRLVGRGTERTRLMMLLVVPFAAVLLGFALERLMEVGMVQDMLQQRFGLQHYDGERFANQRRAFEVATRSPLGIGPGHTELVFHRSAHNAYVRALVENGYLGGLSLTALMIASTLRATWLALEVRDPRTQVAMAMVAASLLALCVESVVIDTVHWRHMWILTAMAWIPTPRSGTGRSRRAG